MLKYFIKRILLLIPTLLGVTLISFVLLNLTPGGPIEQKIQQIRESQQASGQNFGVSEEVIEGLKKQYGFDKPVHTRYIIWVKNLARLDFGKSFSFEEPALDVILSRIPISLQFGLVSFLLIYLVCVPLGIAKAVSDGTSFDHVTSFFLIILYSIPPLMLGILLRNFLANPMYLEWFPLQGAMSDEYEYLSIWGKIVDRAHHFVLPLLCYMISGFTALTFLMKNSLLDEIKLDYVRTARAKGLSEKVVVYKHALKNALIPIVTSLGSFLGIFLAGSIIIEEIFNIYGMGQLSYTALLQRDYNISMGVIFLSSLFLLLGRLISDLVYVAVDPRIDFQ
jgi:microcin C transport system permease protein